MGSCAPGQRGATDTCWLRLQTTHPPASVCAEWPIGLPVPFRELLLDNASANPAHVRVGALAKRQVVRIPSGPLRDVRSRAETAGHAYLFSIHFNTL